MVESPASPSVPRVEMHPKPEVPLPVAIEESPLVPRLSMFAARLAQLAPADRPAEPPSPGLAAPVPPLASVAPPRAQAVVARVATRKPSTFPLLVPSFARPYSRAHTHTAMRG